MTRSILAVLLASCVLSQTIKRDSRCGHSMGCMDCGKPTCSYAIAWNIENDKIHFRFRAAGQGSHYIALGFSDDGNMGEDGVLQCVTAFQKVRISESYNIGYNNTLLEKPEEGITNATGEIVDGVLTCDFLRKTSGTGHPHSLSLHKEWYLLVARGRANWQFAKSKHTMKTTSLERIDLSLTDRVILSGVQFPLIKAHGALMIFAWMFSASIGVVVARWYKPFWRTATETSENKKIWYQIHGVSMCATLLATYIGIVLIFVDRGKLVTVRGAFYQTLHPFLGLFVLLLLTFVFVTGFFSPELETKKRVIFNWIHFVVGRLLFILAYINTVTGSTLLKATTLTGVTYFLLFVCLWQLVVEVALELIERFWSKVPNQDEDDISLPLRRHSRIKVIILFVHVSGIIMLSAITLGMLLLG